MKIQGAKVLVTGGNRGIGLALAKAFRQAGAEVWVGVRDPKAMTEFPAIELDMGSRETIERAVPELEKKEFDILVNNAGLLTGGLLEEQPVDDVYAMFQVNLLGLVQLTRALLPGMVKRGRGKVVNNSSVSGVMNFPLASTYSAAKSGVYAFTRCRAQELRGTGVSTLVMVTPGVKTRMFDEIPKKYGAKMDLKLIEGAISADEWAEAVVNAVLDDREILEPKGFSGLGVFLARHTPGVFNRLVATKYRRDGSF